MNHEFWNEIGNLYFICGAYEPAIHAYLRSIKLENTFGRSYNNLAMAYVQTGRYNDAIKLYRRSIELLSDEKEKATTWNRLGILYRQIKEYDSALEAYQRADLIMPSETAEKASTVRADANNPLTVSMPDIDMDAILAKGNLAKRQVQNSLLAEINAELEMAEIVYDAPKLEEMPLPPEDNGFEPPIRQAQSDWKIAYTEESLVIENPAPAVMQEVEAESEVEELNIIIPVEMQNEAAVENICIEETPTLEAQPEEPEEPEVVAEESIDVVNEEVAVDESATFLEHGVQSEPVETVTSEASEEATQYSQMDYPLMELSAEEQQNIKMQIVKYQQETSKFPNRYINWEQLGEAYKSAGRYREAIQAFQKAIHLNPSNPMIHYRLGLVFAAERKEQEAINAFKRVLDIDANSAQAHASLASQYRKIGSEELAQFHLEKVRTTQFEDETEYNRACLEAICGNNERALELLGQALQEKQTAVTWAQDDPDLDSLRGDQRFQALLSSHAVVV